MKRAAQTGDRVSSLAGKYASMSNSKLKEKVADRDGLAEVGHDIRSMAASLLRQDEVKGRRSLLDRLLGR